MYELTHSHTDSVFCVAVCLQDSNGQVAGGGVSVYYSHVLQMLFFSYSQGKSFAATVNRSNMDMQRLFTINVKG